MCEQRYGGSRENVSVSQGLDPGEWGQRRGPVEVHERPPPPWERCELPEAGAA